MDKAIDRALKFLRITQNEDGGFDGQTSPAVFPFKTEKTYRTTFTPALILGALADVPEAADIRAPLAGWLYRQRSDAWTYNYWAAEEPERQAKPYPDDLDDTFCAISALYRHDPRLVDARALGEIVQILIAAESQVGGPYRTWLATRDSGAVWQDIDLAVNANVAYFLRLTAEPLPNLVSLMDTAIQEDTFLSPYYPGELPVLYYVARAYTGDNTLALSRAIARQQPASPLEYALQCTALLRVGERQKAAVTLERLLACQRADGSWEAAGFCLDPAQEDRPYYQGAAALTTAFAVEALHLYTALPAASTQPAARRPPKYATIITTAKQACSSLQPELRARCHYLIDTMARGDASQEIVMLPQLFAGSLAAPHHIPEHALQQLSLANIFGWMAYTILDDFLDGEGEPALLPAATASMRLSLAAFGQALPGHPAFQAIVRNTFNSIDNANTWEVAHCRMETGTNTVTLAKLPQYGDLQSLADRSLGHTLTPLGVLALTGHNMHGRTVSAMQQSLRHYLVARQLLDDMHDWEQDIRAGHVNAVATAIFLYLDLPAGKHHFDALLPRMREVFWQYTLPDMCRQGHVLLTSARSAAIDSGVLAPASPFYKLYDRLEAIIQHTLDSQSDALAFLQAYKKPPA